VFSPQSVADLGGSDDIQRRRTAALERAAERGLPSFEEEVWRYTPIDDLDLGAYDAGTPGGSAGDAGLTSGLDEGAAAIVEVSNGVVTRSELNASGLEVVTGDAAMDRVGSVMVDAVDVFSEYNVALGSSPVAVVIQRNAVIDGPIVIRHHTDSDGLAWFPRVVVSAGENSEATVVEHHASADVSALVCPVSEIDVGQAARLRHLTVQEMGPRVWQIGSQRSDIGRDAHLAVSHVALGGGYARARIDTRMVGTGSTGDISAVYFGRGDSQLDFRTFQQHVAPHTNSNLLFKGAVDDSARAIYTGMIRIEPEASDVAAYQTNRNLKLSEDAWAESVPNLEIENNDVKCSHASAVGPVDEEQRFYLESRGVPTEIAEALVVRGFFAEVLEQLPVSAVGEATSERIAELLSLQELEEAVA